MVECRSPTPLMRVRILPPVQNVKDKLKNESFEANLRQKINQIDLFNENLKRIKVAKIITYIEESYQELIHKVTWPTWNELQSTSIVVLVASLLFALAIFVMDYVFGINMKNMWSGVMGFFYQMVGLIN
jgi:preprotein translocase subunit SecE